MKRAIENGLRLSEGGSARLADAGGARAFERFDWFYTGAEFCENLLQSADWHEKEVSFFLGKGAKACVMTPPLSGAGVKLLRPVFRRLASVFGRDRAAAKKVEVTVNDFGALELAAETGLGLPLNLGRAMYENIFFVDRTKLLVMNGEAPRLLRSLGVKRFEFSTTGKLLASNLGAAADFGFKAEDIAVTLHYPYLNLTSARACAVGMPDPGPEESVDGIHCRRECRACAYGVSHPLINEGMLVRGNTVFLRFPGKFYKSAAALLNRGIDRLVYSPFP